MAIRKCFVAPTIVCFTLCVLDGQTVSLSNVSHPYTNLEVGDTVKVQITGAAHFGTVTVVQNGNPPYNFGTTDAGGNWSTVATETAPYIGAYNQVWYVNGVALTPNNPSMTYLPYAPRLPNFSVYANFTGSSCPGQSTVSNSCGGTNTARHWIWSPVTYYSTSSISTSAISGWNSPLQSKISLSSNASVRQDITIVDDSTIGSVNAITYSYGQDCDSNCYDLIDQCTGTCFNAAAMYFVRILMNTTDMSNEVAAMNNGTNLATYESAALVHEVGHALRLSDIMPTHGICSEVQSVMYGSGSVKFDCGVNSPTSCDASGINAVYPGAVSFCSTSQNNYCYVPSPSCQ